MQERLLNAKTAYAVLMKFNEQTKYKAQADEMLAKIDTQLQQYTK
jgi:outer membrane protein assembly factor BamD